MYTDLVRVLRRPRARRHSREGGNPGRSMRPDDDSLDSRLRGNDGMMHLLTSSEVCL
jgi:hypothetical protein